MKRRTHTIILIVILACIATHFIYQTNKQMRISKDLYPVLLYFLYIDCNSTKYNAAVFLLENMKYHYSKGRIIEVPENVERWRYMTDSIYWNLIKNTSNLIDNYPWKALREIQTVNRKRVDSIEISKIHTDDNYYLDSEHISSRFLISHINHAFKVWKESKFAQHLTFDEFKEYILPYRSIKGEGYHCSGDHYYSIFAKYLSKDSVPSLRGVVNHYNLTISAWRGLNGNFSERGIKGEYALYAHGLHDCIGNANYGCNVLRAFGVPTVVEYNICYDRWAGRHFMCAIYDTTGTWMTFTPEFDLPSNPNWETGAGKNTLNAYRQLYGAQKDTPFFLKSKEEFVPDMLNDPCIKDVTSYLKKVVPINLPFNKKTTSRLAYLATFHKENEGTFPVTWGIIDSVSSMVHFKNVIPYKMYFPIYYDNGNMEAFGEPFYVTLDSINVSICPLTENTPQKDSLITLTLNRKFASKPNMINVAERLIGGRFEGANKHDFSDAELLHEIKEAPEPYFIQYLFTNYKAYRYYRFIAPEKHPNANISELEWITYKHYNYSNTMKATRPHITAPSCKDILNKESKYVKLLDVKSWDDITWKAEYDGNMQTAPSPYRTIHFMLTSPQSVIGVRFSPLNADNGITAGDEFELYYWDNGWQYGGSSRADYEYISFENIPINKLYWLVNTTRGREELPFIVINGKQHFVYYDILNK